MCDMGNPILVSHKKRQKTGARGTWDPRATFFALFMRRACAKRVCECVVPAVMRLFDFLAREGRTTPTGRRPSYGRGAPEGPGVWTRRRTRSSTSGGVAVKSSVNFGRLSTRKSSQARDTNSKKKKSIFKTRTISIGWINGTEKSIF